MNAPPITPQPTTLTSPQQTAFRAVIQREASQTPRFLFRMWHNQSGGHAGLNTIHAITPLAFHGNRRGPQSLDGIDPQSINDIATRHFVGTMDVETVFSSWSQSFMVVYPWALQYSGENVHISLLDTAKLEPNNVAIHTSALARALHTTPAAVDFVGIEYEFFVFGPVQASAYRTTSVLDFLQTWYLAKSLADHGRIDHDEPYELFPIGMSLESRVNAVRRMSRLYGVLAIVMAAHLIVFATENEHKTEHFVNEIHNTLVFPESWATDGSIVNPDFNHYALPESAEGEDNLTRLVKAKYPAAGIPGRRATLAPQQAAKVALAATKGLLEYRRIPQSVKEHYPKMVANLLIAMHGQETHNAYIEGFRAGFGGADPERGVRQLRNRQIGL